jgi:hypothetical protein
MRKITKSALEIPSSTCSVTNMGNLRCHLMTNRKLHTVLLFQKTAWYALNKILMNQKKNCNVMNHLYVHKYYHRRYIENTLRYLCVRPITSHDIHYPIKPSFQHYLKQKKLFRFNCWLIWNVFRLLYICKIKWHIPECRVTSTVIRDHTRCHLVLTRLA